MTEAAIAAPDEIRTVLRDWELHLRAKGRRPATIASYLTVGSAFSAYLTANGMPTAVGSISREHVEHYLADLRDRVSRPPALGTTAHCSSCFTG